MAQLTPMFAVPFGFAQMPHHEALNAELRALFLAREAEGSAHANPNPYTPRNEALFESHFDLFTWNDRCIAHLREFCLRELVQFVAQLNGYEPTFVQRLRVHTDAWFHITRRNGHFGVHNHPMASWSGVYCVSPGRHDGTASDSGRLSFINPNSLAGMYIDAGNAQMAHPFGRDSHGFDLAPGQLVLFPSWVQHYVMPFVGDGERITVAFNCSFRVQGG